MPPIDEKMTIKLNLRERRTKFQQWNPRKILIIGERNSNDDNEDGLLEDAALNKLLAFIRYT